MTTNTRDPLLEAARTARAKAYAPYSKLHVGAAIALRDGRTFVGANIENASFGLTVCAERNAIAAAVMDGAKPGDVVRVAVIAETEGPIVPCGACRQVLREFGEPRTEVTMASTHTDTQLVLRLAELLPHAFGPGDLPPT